MNQPIPLDLAVFPQSFGPFQGPFSLIASIIGFKVLYLFLFMSYNGFKPFV